MKPSVTITQSESSPEQFNLSHGLIVHVVPNKPGQAEDIAVIFCANSTDDLWVMVFPDRQSFGYSGGEAQPRADLMRQLRKWAWKPAPAGLKITFENTAS